MMHGYGAKAYVDPLVREAREAENRRQRLEDRKARVFDEKARTMGVDTKALEKQVAERREREMQEKMEDQNSANQALSFAETAKQLEGLKQQNLRLERIKLAEEHARQAAEKAAREKSLREMEQKAEAQHLSAPLMVFVGEDTEKAARDKQHQELQKAWVEQQVEEKQRLEALDKQLQQEYEAKVMEMERIAQELNQSVTQRRAQDRVELREIQRQQAELKALMAKQKKELEDAMAQQEIQNMLTSPMLTENPSTTLRVDNPNRHVPYHFKGFSQEQRQQILDTQYQQLMDKAEREQKEKEEHERHEREQEEIRRLAIKTHMQVQRQKSEEAVQLRQEQLQQKAEKDARYTYINKVVYTNPVQETYFQQFGTSAR